MQTKQGVSVYEAFYKQRISGGRRVTIPTVFLNPEIRLLMMAGGLRTAANFLSFGFELFTAAVDNQETQSAVIGWSRNFFIGNASAYFISTALF